MSSQVKDKVSEMESQMEQRLIGAEASVDSYRIAHKAVLRLMQALWVVIIILVGVNLYMVATYKPQGKNYFLSESGSKQRVVALNQPNLNKMYVLSWAEQVASEAMTFGFSDFEQKLGATRGYFTEEGWSGFQSKMLRSTFFKTVLSSQQIVTAVPRNEASIIWQGVRAGTYVWMVQVPLLVMIRAGDNRKSEQITVRMVISRVSTSESPNGLAISRWVSR